MKSIYEKVFNESSERLKAIQSFPKKALPCAYEGVLDTLF